MKFCKNLQRIIEISDPAYSPFFVNYRMLKKLIKDLPKLVPSEDVASKDSPRNYGVPIRGDCRSDSVESFESATNICSAVEQHHGDNTGERKVPRSVAFVGSADASHGDSIEQKKEELGKSPAEIAFFKMLHSEFRKATFFFGKSQQEFEIREERARDGFSIVKKQSNIIMANEQWSMMAKSIFRLYRDLLLLETYAIMAYCSFSKILKKHDKVTGHKTRSAFMTNVVNKANFTHYPKVMEMISRCEKLYDEVSQRLLQEGKEGLYEDERLFINMITRLNDQVLETPDGEGAADESRKEVKRPTVALDPPVTIFSPHLSQKPESEAVSTLRSLVEQNEMRALAATVSEGIAGVDSDDRKRSAKNSPPIMKRSKLE